MVKGWGDNYSSDDDEDHSERIDQMEMTDEVVEQVEDDNKNKKYEPKSTSAWRDSKGGGGQQDRQNNTTNNRRDPNKVYNYPTEPPYTAYVGNLPFSIQDTQTLGEKVMELVEKHFRSTSTDNNEKDETLLRIKDVKIIRDRETNQSRGFAYIEVETLPMLQLLMKLNTVGMYENTAAEDDDNVETNEPSSIGATIDGRYIQFDTSNQHGSSNNNNNSHDHNRSTGGYNRGGNHNDDRRGRQSYNNSSSHHYNNNNDQHQRGSGGGFNEINGSNFRGGKYRNNNNANRDDPSTSTTTGETTTTDSGPPKQRPVLVLKPRTKPLENNLPPLQPGGGAIAKSTPPTASTTSPVVPTTILSPLKGATAPVSKTNDAPLAAPNPTGSTGATEPTKAAPVVAKEKVADNDKNTIDDVSERSGNSTGDKKEKVSDKKVTERSVGDWRKRSGATPASDTVDSSGVAAPETPATVSPTTGRGSGGGRFGSGRGHVEGGGRTSSTAQSGRGHHSTFTRTHTDDRRGSGSRSGGGRTNDDRRFGGRSSSYNNNTEGGGRGGRGGAYSDRLSTSSSTGRGERGASFSKGTTDNVTTGGRFQSGRGGSSGRYKSNPSTAHHSHSSTSVNDKKSSGVASDEVRPKKTFVTNPEPVVESSEATTKPAKIVNSFAALRYDSDSD